MYRIFSDSEIQSRTILCTWFLLICPFVVWHTSMQYVWIHDFLSTKYLLITSIFRSSGAVCCGIDDEPWQQAVCSKVVGPFHTPEEAYGGYTDENKNTTEVRYKLMFLFIWSMWIHHVIFYFLHSLLRRQSGLAHIPKFTCADYLVSQDWLRVIDFVELTCVHLRTWVLI